MVEFGSNWDADDEFDDLLGILDFPMESLEGDGLVEEWDISNSQCLGPIPSNILMGPPTSPSKKVDAGPPHLFRGPLASIAGAQEQKQLPNHVDASSAHISQQNKSANAQESGAFETQSPISVLESSGSCCGGKSLSIKSDNAIPVRSRSKRVRPAGVNPWLLALSALSISQKTSNARRSRESRKELFQQPLAMDVIKDSAKKFESSLGISDSAHPQNGSSHRPRVKKCTRCESTTTPQWREGPLGPKTLCNACGVRYRKARRSRESRKQLFQQPVAKDVIKDPPKKSENSLGVSDCARPQNASSHRPVVVKKCTHCESTKTPQWREGPLGPKTLCNACGVRYRTGRLFPEYRPAASPTFVPSQHSNSHKKVVEMRSKAKQQEAKIEEPPISWQPKAKTEEPPRSPQPEFVPMSSYLFDYIY